MLNSAKNALVGMKLLAIIVGACVAGAMIIAVGMMAATHMRNPGYIPPEKVAPAKGPCYSFELNCHNTIKHSLSYFESGKYLNS